MILRGPVTLRARSGEKAIPPFQRPTSVYLLATRFSSDTLMSNPREYGQESEYGYIYCFIYFNVCCGLPGGPRVKTIFTMPLQLCLLSE